MANAYYSQCAGHALIANTVVNNAQPNITSVGTLTSVTVSGLVRGGNIVANGLGSISTAGTVYGTSIIGTIITGTVSTNAQPNITSLGLLNNLTVVGNVSGCTFFGQASGLGNVPGANVTGTLIVPTTSWAATVTVSYTHLTLPTNREV